MEWGVAVHKKHVASYCEQISVVICFCMILVVNKIKLREATPGCTTEFAYVTYHLSQELRWKYIFRLRA